MRKSLRRAVVATALTVPLVFGTGAGTAAAAPQVTNLQVPIVTGFQIAPGAVPGGLFQTIPIRANIGEAPGVVSFSAANIAEFHDQYPYRFLTVHWRNLQTGATGSEGLRHWQDVDREPLIWDPAVPGGNVPAPELIGERLPLEVTANTGPGPVAVAVTHSREYYYSAPYPDTLIPGLGVLLVP